MSKEWRWVVVSLGELAGALEHSQLVALLVVGFY